MGAESAGQAGRGAETGGRGQKLQQGEKGVGGEETAEGQVTGRAGMGGRQQGTASVGVERQQVTRCGEARGKGQVACPSTACPTVCPLPLFSMLQR